MPRKPSYTRDSVERALDVHTSRGLLRAWNRVADDRYRASLTSGPDLELRSLREAYVFVNGLATAAQAITTGRA
jgi:hypothetical protein